MTYESFKAALIQELDVCFPSGTSISIQSLPRNNSVMLDGLTILEPGHNITPTIYLQDYYQRFKSGVSMARLMQDILSVYSAHRPSQNIDPSFFCDFQYVKKRIVYKLIHYKKNKELLQEIPHVPYLDLAVVFYCLLNSNSAGTATVLIRNSHLSLWNTDTLMLYRLARSNTPFLLTSSCSSMSRLLYPYLTEEKAMLLKEPGDTFAPMYVLTNEIRMYGAVCILYQDLLSDIAKDLCSDLYILPSSIHEVILMPAPRALSGRYLNSMIKEVNETQLDHEDILSDHVYYFSLEKKRISFETA